MRTNIEIARDVAAQECHSAVVVQKALARNGSKAVFSIRRLKNLEKCVVTFTV